MLFPPLKLQKCILYFRSVFDWQFGPTSPCDVGGIYYLCVYTVAFTLDYH